MYFSIWIQQMGKNKVTHYHLILGFQKTYVRIKWEFLKIWQYLTIKFLQNIFIGEFLQN